MNDPLDVPLIDAVLIAELEITTRLIVAANETDCHLSQDEVDALLDVRPSPDSASECNGHSSERR